MRLIRDDQNDRRTFGAFVTEEGLRLCDTLELPWRDNQREVSCIPLGDYQLVYAFSPKHHRDLWHIQPVPDRDNTEIHIGNTTADTLGCVLVGDVRDGDAVDRSLSAFSRFMAYMGARKGERLSVEVA